MKREFNKFINSLSEKELIKELQQLYSKLEPVRQYYQMELGEDAQAVISTFKQSIKKEYFPNRGYGAARNSVSRKVITEFKKIAVHSKYVVELLLYRAEMMIEFSDHYGDMEEAFYNSLGSSYKEACKLIKKEKLESLFKPLCRELIAKTYSFGYGVTFELEDYYRECFGEQP